MVSFHRIPTSEPRGKWSGKIWTSFLRYLYRVVTDFTCCCSSLAS